jgi:hypothetical protein
MNVNKTHHQNSGLAAQPSKIAYLLKQTLIASPNVIDPLVAMVVHSLGYACWNNQRKSCDQYYRFCGKRRSGAAIP